MIEYKLKKYVVNTVDNFPRLIFFLPFMFTIIIVKWHSGCQCSFASLTRNILFLLKMKLSWSNTRSILVILIPQRVTSCVSTEKHGEGFHKDVDAGNVCLTSQPP